ncbi:MAG: hypothetical protein RLZZ301_1453 [Bacteroidota bacterium]|jgi:N-acetylneuraminic acid mutarotase
MKYFVILLSFFPLVAVAQGNQWTKKSDAGMGKRERASSFAIGDYGYICGGVDTNEVPHHDLWAYHPQTDAWSQKADLPGPARRDAVSFVINGIGYVGTGMDSVSAIVGTKLSDFWSYNPQLNSWSAVAAFPGNAGGGIYFATGFAVDGKGYLCGGKIGASLYSNQLWEYKPSNDQWIQRADYPGGLRYQLSSFVIGNKAYVGMGTDQNTFKKDIYAYNPGSNTWAPIAPFPAYERGCASTFVLEDRGFICLGTNGGLLGDLLEYNPQTNTWALRAAYGGSARRNAASFVINGKAYVGIGDGYSGKKASWYEYAPCNFAAVQELEEQLTQIPNPVVDQVIIKNPNAFITNLSILSYTGEMLDKYCFSSATEVTLDLRRLSAGNYLITFELSDGQVLTKKIVKL